MMAPKPNKDPQNTPGTGRPFVGIHFVCCNVYARIYLNRLGTAYAGHCPRCARPINLPVAECGPDEKFWRAG